MKAEQNEEITRIGPDTPAGALMRRYWQPAALVDELPGERPIKAVRLLGEDLVIFRDESGGYGLLGKHCPHRGADLCFGRLEDGGLRCTFHGWLFDREGKCLEQPAEPPGSAYHTHIRQTAYPCRERNGIIFAYLGPGEPPAFPDFDCFLAPEEFTFSFKGFIDCNWLQALEVGIDPAHASFLHRFFEDEDPAQSYGKQFRDRAADTDIPMTRVLREQYCPEIKVETTEYGLRIISLRQINERNMHVRVTNQAFPHAIIIPMSNEMTITQWHVPVDDYRCYWYAIFTSFGDPVDKEQMRRQRLELYTLPDYMPRQNKSNNYGFETAEQRTQTYTGMGKDINVHDQWAVESLGPIQDRTQEHLGKSDAAISAYRRLLRKAINDVEEGNPPLMIVPDEEAARIRGPVAIDAIGPAENWENCWKEHDLKRREKSSWAADLG